MVSLELSIHSGGFSHLQSLIWTGDRFCCELHPFKSRATLIWPPISIYGQRWHTEMNHDEGRHHARKEKEHYTSKEALNLKGHSQWMKENVSLFERKKKLKLKITFKNLKKKSSSYLYYSFFFLVVYKQFQCFLIIMFVNIYSAVTQISRNAIFLQNTPG